MFFFHWCFSLLVLAMQENCRINNQCSCKRQTLYHCVLYTCMHRIFILHVCACVRACVCITVHNCLLSFTDSMLIMSVTPCPLCCWIIDAGSTVRIRDRAMIDECFMLPFILYMNFGGISMAVCYCFQQQWHSVNVLCMFHMHITFPTTLISFHYSTYS